MTHQTTCWLTRHRGTLYSFADKLKSSQTTTDISTSKLNDASPVADVDATTKTESDADDWEELAEVSPSRRSANHKLWVVTLL